jgi:hypothetical protein
MVDLFALRGSGRRGTSCHVMQITADTHRNYWLSFAVFSGETRWETNRQKMSGTAKVQAECVEADDAWRAQHIDLVMSLLRF